MEDDLRCSDTPVVFVVGTGRCGSTLLSNLLNRHHDVLSLSELFVSLQPGCFVLDHPNGDQLWSLLTGPKRSVRVLGRHGLLPEEFIYPSSGRYAADEVPPICMTTLPHLASDPDRLLDELEPFVRALPPGPMPAQLRKVFGWLAGKFGRQMAVERSGASLAYIDQLLRMFPDASFVHIVRDPLTCALSMRDHHAFRMGRIRMRLAKELGFDPYDSDAPFDPMALPDPLPSLTPEHFDREAYLRYPFTPSDFGWLWSALIMAGLPTLKSLPSERLLTVGYEDLLQQPVDVLSQLGAFLGLRNAGEWALESAQRIRSSASADRRLRELTECQLSELKRSVSVASRAIDRQRRAAAR